MSFIKTLGTDLLNGFPVTDFPLMLIQLFAALIMALLVINVSGKLKDQRTYVLLLVVVVAFITMLCKQSIQLSVLFAGMGILMAGLVKNYFDDKQDALLLAVILGLSFACGTGYVLPAFIAVVVFILPLLWLGRKF